MQQANHVPSDITIDEKTDEAVAHDDEEYNWDIFEEADEDGEVGTHPSEEAKEYEEADREMLPYEQVDGDVLDLLWDEESLGNHVREEAMRLCGWLQKLITAGVNVRQIRGVRGSMLILSLALVRVFERDLTGTRWGLPQCESFIKRSRVLGLLPNGSKISLHPPFQHFSRIPPSQLLCGVFMSRSKSSPVMWSLW